MVGLNIMAKKKVFVSFDYDEDKHYKLLLQAWDANKKFYFNFNDQSVTNPIDSNKSSRIKAGITNKMNDSTYCLIIIGKHTHKSKWVSWEIENAHKLGLKLVAVKIDKSYKTPDALYDKNASWAMKFKQDSIIDAMEKCNSNNNDSNLSVRNVNVPESVACKRCGRKLTNPTSVKLGMGPYCRTKT